MSHQYFWILWHHLHNYTQVTHEAISTLHWHLSNLDYVRRAVTQHSAMARHVSGNYRTCSRRLREFAYSGYHIGKVIIHLLAFHKADSFMGIIAGWSLGLYKWAHVEWDSIFSNDRTIPQNDLPQRKTQCGAQSFSFCKGRKNEDQQGKREAERTSPYAADDFSRRAFWDVMPPFWGQPSSPLPQWVSADKRGAAPHCHSGGEEKKYNPDSREALLWSEKKGPLSVDCLHDGWFNR